MYGCDATPAVFETYFGEPLYQPLHFCLRGQAPRPSSQHQLLYRSVLLYYSVYFQAMALIIGLYFHFYTSKYQNTVYIEILK